jgi:mannose/fructose/N-acetylgalactosamine-specific phosphotransferase system component IIC
MPDSTAVTAAIAAYGLFVGIFILVIFVLQLVICWRIASKAGYSGVMSLLMLVPFINFIIILIFAFAEWPIEARLRALTAGGGGLPPPGMMPPSGGAPMRIQ